METVNQQLVQQFSLDIRDNVTRPEGAGRNVLHMFQSVKSRGKFLYA